MNRTKEPGELIEAVWIAGHLRGAARELRELVAFLGGERDTLAVQADPFSVGGVSALSLALIHMRQRAIELERAASRFEALTDNLGVELPEVQMLAVARLVPDADVQCNECGSLPTVRAQLSDGTTRNTGQCGPCFFGSASYRNPDTWNTSRNVK
jgi:hypothetical protein